MSSRSNAVTNVVQSASLISSLIFFSLRRDITNSSSVLSSSGFFMNRISACTLERDSCALASSRSKNLSSFPSNRCNENMVVTYREGCSVGKPWYSNRLAAALPWFCAIFQTKGGREINGLNQQESTGA